MAAPALTTTAASVDELADADAHKWAAVLTKVECGCADLLPVHTRGALDLRCLVVVVVTPIMLIDEDKYLFLLVRFHCRCCGMINSSGHGA